MADLGSEQADLGSQIRQENAKSATEIPNPPSENAQYAAIEVVEESEVPSRALARESPRDLGMPRAGASRASASRASVGKILPSARAHAYALIQTPRDFEDALETLNRCTEVGVDTETTTLHAQQGGRIRVLQLASSDQVYVCDLDAIGDWKTPLRAFWRNRNGPRLVLQEAVFDLGWLQSAGFALPHWSRLFDTRLAARLTERRGQPGFLSTT